MSLINVNFIIKFCKRMLESGLKLKNYKEVLDANRDGLLKKAYNKE